MVGLQTPEFDTAGLAGGHQEEVGEKERGEGGRVMEHRETLKRDL